MRLALFLVFWILYTGGVLAQSKFTPAELDSLRNIWNNPMEMDSNRLDAIQQLSWYGYLFSQPDSAFYYAQKQYDLAELIDDQKAMSRARYTQGVSFYIQSEFRTAKDYYADGLALQRAINDLYGIANSLSVLGIIYDQLGEFDVAVDHYQEALTIQKELDDKYGISSTLANIGAIYQHQGFLAKAFEYYNKSLKLKKEIDDQKGIAISYNNLGVLHKLQGDYTKAIEYYLQSLSIKKQIGDKHGTAVALNNLGNSHRQKGEFEQALSYFDQSNKLYNELNDQQGMSNTYLNRGMIYHDRHNLDKAIENYTKSLEIKEAIGNKSGMPVTLNNLGLGYLDKGDTDKAIEYSGRALKIASDIKILKEVKESSKVLLEAYLKKKEYEKAILNLERMLSAIIEELNANYFTLPESEKELYFHTMEDEFGWQYNFTLNLHSTYPNLADTAFNLALRIKGLSLKSTVAMRQLILNSGDTTLIHDFEKWLSTQKELAKSFKKGEKNKQLKEQADKLERKLTIESTLFKNFEEMKHMDWKQVRDELNEDECAIEFVHFRQRMDSLNDVSYMALIVRPHFTHPVVVNLCDESKLATVLGRHTGNNASYVEKVYGTRTSPQTELYETIWKPLENYLDNVRVVYYSPSGLLHKISFSALCVKSNEFLCDKYDLRNLGSTGKIVRSNEVNLTDSDDFVLMGGVDYNKDSTGNEIWSYLPGSQKEVRTIENHLKTENRKVKGYFSARASEKRFKSVSTSAEIIHTATHGFFFPDPSQIKKNMLDTTESIDDLNFRGSPKYANWSFVQNSNPLMRSGIVLAGANEVWTRDPLEEGEDGILTALEVSHLNLTGTKLVVLSACETGLGDIKGSEGVYGLQRSFKMAGVKHLIMSLWQVPDKETAEFMTTFYKHLTKTNNIKKSFNFTQKTMRKKYDPYYWGAFILIE